MRPTQLDSSAFDEIADVLRVSGGARNVMRDPADGQIIATMSKPVGGDSVVGALIIGRTLYGLEASLTTSAPEGFDGLDVVTQAVGLDAATACLWAAMLLGLVVSHVENIALLAASAAAGR